jgi:Glucodextranase, domain N
VHARLPRRAAPADKHGFGTAHQLAGNAYFTLRQASLSEVYSPRSPVSSGHSRPCVWPAAVGKMFQSPPSAVSP